jgi:hypothetical protein
MKKKRLKTADEVTIKDGSAIYVPGPWIAHIERVRYTPDGKLKSDYAGTVFRGGIVDPKLCYSTSEAATAAYEKTKKAKNEKPSPPQ